MTTPGEVFGETVNRPLLAEVFRDHGIRCDDVADRDEEGGWSFGTNMRWWMQDVEGDLESTLNFDTAQDCVRDLVGSHDAFEEARQELLEWLGGVGPSLPGCGAATTRDAPDPAEPAPGLRAELARVTAERDALLAQLAHLLQD